MALKARSAEIAPQFPVIALPPNEEILRSSPIVEFRARNRDSSIGSPGHAFILIGRKLPDGSTYFYAAGGFYPREESINSTNGNLDYLSAWRFVIAGVVGSPGMVSYNFDDLNYDVSFRVNITPDQERRALHVLRNWQSRNYALFWQNCTSLIKDVAKTIGLDVSLFDPASVWPDDAVRRLQEINHPDRPLRAHQNQERSAEQEAERLSREQRERLQRQQQERRARENALRQPTPMDSLPSLLVPAPPSDGARMRQIFP